MGAEWEVTPREIVSKTAEGYCIVDIRNTATTAYGVIPGAVVLSADELKEHIKEFQQTAGVIIYCTRGVSSEKAVENLRERGVNAYSLRAAIWAGLLT